MSRSDHEILKAVLKSAASLTASLNNGSGRGALKNVAVRRANADASQRTGGFRISIM
jgi:hypothetical protein